MISDKGDQSLQGDFPPEMVPRTKTTCRYLNPPVNVPGTKARAESHVPSSHRFQPAGLDEIAG